MREVKRFIKLGRFTSTQEFLNEMFKKYKRLTFDDLQYLKDSGHMYENEFTCVWYIKKSYLPFLQARLF